MFRKINALSALFCVLFLNTISLAEDTITTINDTLTEELKDSSIPITDLEFNFQNNKDSLTLILLEKGTLTFSWSDIDSENKFLGIRIKDSNADTSVWNEYSVAIDAGELKIIDINENLIFDFQLGLGNSASDITYATKTLKCHSISETIFKNNSSKSKEEGADIMWAIQHDKLNQLLSIYPDASFSLKYNTKIGEKQNKAYKEKSLWTKEDDISINSVKFKLGELTGGEKYVYKVGLNLDDKTIWSKKGKFTTKRSWGIFRLLVLIGALGMFIFGMKIMSEGLQMAAGSRLREMLGSITSNRVKGVFTGFGITSIVQSSSVTTVMTVSFVNAGLMTLRQSAGVMMGANIGTTITAWLILIFGFKVSLGSYALIFIAFGAPMLFFTKGKAKIWASTIIGFALLFMGLGELKSAAPSLGTDSGIVQFFIDFKDVWYGPLMFTFLGALVTVVIQSSSAAMALTMTMVGGGVIPFEVASAMILGENIGTTITAELASLIGNVHAKRSARIHSLFNIIGVTWAILLFPVLLRGIASIIDGDPYSDGNVANLGLAIFHSSFNILNVLVLIWFVPWLVKIAEKTVKSRGAKDEEFHLDYIGAGMMGTPEISILEARKEVAKFGKITSKMSGFIQILLTEQDKKQKTKLYSKVRKYEEITDRVEEEISIYLGKVAEGEMSEDVSLRVRGMLSVINDLERIGDIFFQMSKTIERKEEDKIWFTQEQRDNLKNMFRKLDQALEVMVENLNSDYEGVSLKKAEDLEREINSLRNQLRKQHFEKIEKGEYNVKSGMAYNDLFASCEKVGDHIINVSEAVSGKI